MALQVDERRVARRLVARRVEREPVPLAAADVALGHQLRPRLREREVDVEENGAQAHAVLQEPLHGLDVRVDVVAAARPRDRLRDRPARARGRGRARARRTAGRGGRARRACECPSSNERTIGATENSRSPASGFGSMTSHGSRCAASTFSPCRSWCRSTCSPCVGASSREVVERGVAGAAGRARPAARARSRAPPPPRAGGSRRRSARAAAADSTKHAERIVAPSERNAPGSQRSSSSALPLVVAREQRAPRRRRPSARARRPPAPPRGAATTPSAPRASRPRSSTRTTCPHAPGTYGAPARRSHSLQQSVTRLGDVRAPAGDLCERGCRPWRGG